VLVLTGVALNLEERTTPAPAIILIIAGQIVTFISLFFMLRKKKVVDHEVYPEPDPEDFKDNEPDIFTVEEKK
jgi:tellurite resistance protein TehA-like permease